jgi:hypothetical protein
MKITKKELFAFNKTLGGGIKDAVSYNENVNKQRGLPPPDIRAALRKIHSDEFGIMGGKLTFAIIKKHLSE